MEFPGLSISLGEKDKQLSTVQKKIVQVPGSKADLNKLIPFNTQEKPSLPSFKNWLLSKFGYPSGRTKHIEGPNHTFIVEWPGAIIDGEAKSVFRVTNHYPTQLIELLDKLSCAGVSVTPALKFNGDLYHQSSMGIVVRYKFAAGKSLHGNELSVIQAHQFGREIAKFHAEINTWKTSPLEATPLDLSGFKEHINYIEQWEPLFTSTALKEAQILAEELCSTLKNLVIDISFCHGDCHTHNALFDESTNNVTLLDWDTFARGYTLYDIGTALSCFQNRPEVEESLLKGYSEGIDRSLNKDEKKAIDIFRVLRLLVLASMVVQLNEDWLKDVVGATKTRDPLKAENPGDPSEEGCMDDLRNKLQIFIRAGKELGFGSSANA